MTNPTQIEASESQVLDGESSPARAQNGCCGGPAPQGADGCCALDAEVKASGGSGCGCAPKAASGTTRRKGCC